MNLCVTENDHGSAARGDQEAACGIVCPAEDQDAATSTKSEGQGVDQDATNISEGLAQDQEAESGTDSLNQAICDRDSASQAHEVREEETGLDRINVLSFQLLQSTNEMSALRRRI